jgi:hypothetical protein
VQQSDQTSGSTTASKNASPVSSGTGDASGIRLRRVTSGQLSRQQIWYLAILAIILDAAIVGPLIRSGSVHLLDFGDYPVSPHPPFAVSAFGFPPGITSRAPIDAMLYWIFQDIRWAPLHLLPFVSIAPLACLGFARIFPGRALAIAAASLLFTVNPFVYERMASGQVYVVMGYTLLPVLFALMIRPLGSLVATSALGGLIFTLDIALSVHYLFIAGFMIIIVIPTHMTSCSRRAAKAGAGIVACGGVLNLYWLIPAARATLTMRSPVTALDLSTFQTIGDPIWGLGVNVAGLYGFWRSGPPLVKSHISGWPFLLLTILLVAILGFYTAYTEGRPASRAFALSCAALAIGGGLLAVGTRGPVGGMYAWLFGHVPGFKVMREPEKFSALVALAYAACFGAGAEAAARQVTRHLPRVLCMTCIAAIPLVYGYTELWGFAGYARPSVYPASWAAADRAMSPGATALALPFRSYLQVPWMGDRVVANPMLGFFARPVISSDDLEAGSIETETSNPRSLFLQFCLNEGSRGSNFGRLLSPLGIRYVILAKVPGAQSFAWLNRQHDLRKIFDASSIAVYQNDEAVPTAYEPARQIVLQDWGQVVALAQRTSLNGYLIHVRHARPGPVEVPETGVVPSYRTATPIRATGGTLVAESLDIPARARVVVLTDPAYAGWRLAGFRTTSQFGTTVAFTRSTPPDRDTVLVATYGPWQLVEKCDVVGCCLAVGVVVLLITLFFRRRPRVSVGARPTKW